MDTIRKILVPTDFSAPADEAFRVACKLAGAVGAKVLLFHVARPPAVISEGGKFLANPKSADKSDLWDRFHPIQPADGKVPVEYEVIVADRPGAKHILDILDKLGCDLIVMGTHRRFWLKHLLFRSVAEVVVRLARCPVMVVKATRSAVAPSMSKPDQLTRQPLAGSR